MAEKTGHIIGMRDSFFDALFPLFQRDRDCVIITADNGAPSLDKFAQELPDQFFTVGIAEQQMFGMAAGMANEGKKVWVYAIAPFVTTRVHEFVKLDVCAMNLPITILGVGAGFAYDNMGPSHHTLEDIAVMRVYPGLEIWSPADSRCAALLAEKSWKNDKPMYIRFDRTGLPDIYQDDEAKYAVEQGCVGSTTYADKDMADVGIIATGVMTHQAGKVAARLNTQYGLSVLVVDVIRIKPFSMTLSELSVDVQRWVTLDEQYLAGGLGSIVAEIMKDSNINVPLLRIGMRDEFCFTYGGREAIWKKFGLDVETVTKQIAVWCV